MVKNFPDGFVAYEGKYGGIFVNDELYESDVDDWLIGSFLDDVEFLEHFAYDIILDANDINDCGAYDLSYVLYAIGSDIPERDAYRIVKKAKEGKR